jgi:hypothetical protein
MSSKKRDPLFNNKDRIGEFSLGIFITCLTFAVPLGLMYSMFFYKKTSWYRIPLLFGAILGLGYLGNLMFYRIAIRGDKKAEIDKMSGRDAFFVLYNTLAGFVVVFITMFALSTNNSLVAIFENTLGYLFIHFWGVTDLCNSIFVSPKFSEYSNIDTHDFNYNFLITRMTTQNVDEFIDAAKTCQGKMGNSNLPLDFYIKFEYEDQVEKLKNLVSMKYAFGHFVWVYLSSIVAMIISMTACIMNS